MMRQLIHSSVCRRFVGWGVSVSGRRGKHSQQGAQSTRTSASGHPSQMVGSTAPLGQPSPATHPHLVKPGEVMRGIELREVVERRERLVERLLSSRTAAESGHHVLVIPSSSVFYMAPDVPYIFRQDSDFRYLTGCLEPDTALVMIISSSERKYSSLLFTRQNNQHTQLWDGPRTGVERAVEYFGVDEAYPLSEVQEVLGSKLKSIGASFSLWFDFQGCLQPTLTENISSLVRDMSCQEVLDPETLVHSLRVIKSKAEVSLMREACDVTCRSLEDAIQASPSLVSEHHVFAKLDYEARVRGAERLAYPPVVAWGDNANIIHYITNDQVFPDSQRLLLVDTGCEVGGYCSDVTRTWGVRGGMSEAQRTLYDVVLRVQELCLSQLSTHPSLDAVLSTMCDSLYKTLQEAHVLTPAARDHQPRQVAHRFCPHHVGHYLGMDVHDTASVPRKIPLVPGMVITVEPGVYIRECNDFAREEFRGTGIRIEDDVLITSAGYDVLTQCAKTSLELDRLSTQHST